jgi:hypothetical protein
MTQLGGTRPPDAQQHLRLGSAAGPNCEKFP